MDTRVQRRAEIVPVRVSSDAPSSGLLKMRNEAMHHLKQAVAIFAEVGEPERHEPEIWKLVDW